MGTYEPNFNGAYIGAGKLLTNEELCQIFCF